ncbi:hypothetical protein Aperf_G00000006780 [Anoplocephala perfoliata]
MSQRGAIEILSDGNPRRRHQDRVAGRRRKRMATPSSSFLVSAPSLTTSITTFHVCLLCALLFASQILNVEGALGKSRRSISFNPPTSSGRAALPQLEFDHLDSGESQIRVKRQWGDDLMTGDDLDDVNNAVLASEKTALTEEEIRKYLAQMKAYYLKNGSPRYG